MIKVAEWEPEAFQIDWVKNLIASIKPNGTWGLPNTGLIYTLDKKNKELHLIMGNLENPESLELHNRNKKVFGILNWKVLDKRDKKAGFFGSVEL